jgi:hypothetical protein
MLLTTLSVVETTERRCMSKKDRWNDTDRGKPKYSEKNVSQCYFVHHKTKTKWSGIETEPLKYVTQTTASVMGRP